MAPWISPGYLWDNKHGYLSTCALGHNLIGPLKHLFHYIPAPDSPAYSTLQCQKLSWGRKTCRCGQTSQELKCTMQRCTIWSNLVLVRAHPLSKAAKIFSHETLCYALCIAMNIPLLCMFFENLSQRDMKGGNQEEKSWACTQVSHVVWTCTHASWSLTRDNASGLLSFGLSVT